MSKRIYFYESKKLKYNHKSYKLGWYIMFESSVLEYFILCGGFVGVSAFYLQHKKLHTSLAMLDDIVSTSEIGKIIFNKNGSFHKANAVACEYLSFLEGRERLKINICDFLDFIFDNSTEADKFLPSFSVHQVRNEALYDFREIISLHDDGACLVRGRKLHTGQTVFSISDISLNRKREAHYYTMGKENYQLSQAVEAVTCGIMVGDACRTGNQVIFVNDALCDFLNVKREDLVGGDWAALMRMLKDKDEREKLIKSINNLHDVEVEACSKHGDKTRWFSVKVTPILNAYGRLDLLVAVLSETTLLKQREAEFFQAQKLEALGQLAAGIAHDFNNILSIIDGFATMTVGALYKEDEKPKEYLRRISLASQRGADLTRKMLTFSKHKIVTKSVIDLRSVLTEQETLLQPLLSGDIKFKMIWPSEPVHIKGSADAVGHILMNLAINARDAMFGSGTLLVELSIPDVSSIHEKLKKDVSAEHFACLMVSDTGTGMDEKTLSRVFDPFFTTKERGKGTGLGMSVVYGLVQELGGFIDISSKIGEGTNIYVYIPVCEDAVSRAVLGNPSDIGTLVLDGYTAMVVEDEPDLREIVCCILERAGMTVYSAENGNDALCVQDEIDDQIDILLTDVVMPELNGVKLAELFSALRPETRIIFMSGFPSDGDLAPVTLPEDAHFIAKPMNYEGLLKVLYEILVKDRGIKNSKIYNGQLPHWESVT